MQEKKCVYIIYQFDHCRIIPLSPSKKHTQWILFLILTEVSSQSFFINICSKLSQIFFPYYLHLPTVFLPHVQIWLHHLSLHICQHCNLAHSFLISCKCSILLPMAFLSYKYPSSPTFVAAALIFFNLLSHFCHHSHKELRRWWIWLAIALL